MNQRVMISFADGDRRFNFRTAAIIEREGAVLVHRGVGSPHWTLPGGRVEMGESSIIALQRELAEELGVAAEVGPLRMVIENFFSVDGVSAHQVGLYYDTRLPDTFPFRLDAPCHTIEDEGVLLEFMWVPRNERALSELGVFPVVLREQLSRLADHPLHLITEET